MIYVGVTGWRDHDTLYHDGVKATEKLSHYASHFPVVELDSTFYAIQPQRNIEKWIADTPNNFRFIVKAYKGMTGHERGDNPFKDKREMYEAFLMSLEPMVQAGKLAMVLFQFPPWFELNKQHVTKLRQIKKAMAEIPVALEFRHQSWFEPHVKQKTLAFMEEEGWIHCICDEPQVGQGSVPIVLHPTAPVTLVRFHGRNTYGWQRSRDKNWREVRYLYRYTETELAEWARRIRELEKQCDHVYVLFNNNSGGDAADNAKTLIGLLQIEYEQLAPRQLNLFSE